MKRIEEAAARRQMIEVGRWMYDRGWIAAGDGNLSVRLSSDRFLVTPTGRNKGRLRGTDLVLVDGKGEPVYGNSLPSSEFRMHLAIYAAFDDVRAVVHAHPPTCVALTLAGIGMDEPVLPETFLDLGTVPTAPYATPTTDQVPKSIHSFLESARGALLLERHGSVTWGQSLEQAWDRLDRLEHSARILHLAYQLGAVHPLKVPEVRELQRVRDRLQHHDE